MPTLTPKLGIKKPLGNETARRSSFNENYDIIDRMAAREPFLVKNAVYDSGNDRIDITIGAGRAAFLGTLVAKDTDTVYSIHEPSVNTSYYLYLKNDGTFLHNTTGGEMTGAVLIWKISTGVSVDEITIQDMRGELPGAEAQALKDELIPQIHTAQQTAENAASTATAAQATAENHATRHAAGGPDALTPAMIGAETPSGAQSKADQAEANAKAYSDAMFLPKTGGTITGTLTLRNQVYHHAVTIPNDGLWHEIINGAGTVYWYELVYHHDLPHNPVLGVLRFTMGNALGNRPIYQWDAKRYGNDLHPQIAWVTNGSDGRILIKANGAETTVYIKTIGSRIGTLLSGSITYSDLSGFSTVFEFVKADQGTIFSGLRVESSGVAQPVWHSGNAGPFYRGAGSPEGVVTAPVGAIYQRTNGGAGSTFYVKESGSGNTGWVAK